MENEQWATIQVQTWLAKMLMCAKPLITVLLFYKPSTVISRQDRLL